MAGSAVRVVDREDRRDWIQGLKSLLGRELRTDAWFIKSQEGEWGGPGCLS